MYEASQGGNRAAVALLLKYGADPDTVVNGSPIILYLAASCQPKIMALLIEHGADLNAVDTNTGNTALHVARRMDIVRLLLKHGARLDLERKDAFNRTPLDAAVRRKDFDKARLLVRHGADKTTALQYLLRNARPEMLQMLQTEKSQVKSKG